MKVIFSPLITRLLYILSVAVLIGGITVFFLSLPWTLEQRLLGITASTSLIFLLIIFRQLGTPRPDEPDVARFVANRELFEELYENSPVPYVRTRKDGTIIDVNAKALQLFNVRESEVVGSDLFSYLTGDEKTADHIARIPNLVSAGAFVNDQEGIVKRADGEMRWVIVSAFPYANQSESLVTLVDITKQKNIDAAKSEFVSLASHQLRTPISSIKWNMELLSSPLIGTLNDKQKQYVDKVNRSAVRMGLLINDFLDASQLEMGTFEGHAETIELAGFIDEQLEEFVERVMSKQLVVKRAYTPEQLNLTVDSHLLRMVLTNLISNAVKYTPPKGTVTVGYEVHEGQVHISVTDTGMGIPEQDHEKLFGKFFRASNTRESLIEGTGIGLYIVRQAVKKMFGSLSFGSKEGVGTRFVVSLPLSSDSARV